MRDSVKPAPALAPSGLVERLLSGKWYLTVQGGAEPSTRQDDTPIEAAAEIRRLTAEGDDWKEVARKSGVCMSCALRTPGPYGCVDCLNTGWNGGAPIGFVEEIVLAASEARNKELREALEWYGEQARLARLVHSGGDAGRNALAADGGNRALAALTAKGRGR